MKILSSLCSRKTLIFVPIGFFLLSVQFFSCTGDNACKQSRNVSLTVNFRTPTKKSEKDTVLPYLTIYGIPHSDSLLYDSASVAKVTLPLNPSLDTTGFVFQCNNLSDTILLAYSRSLHLLSYECGFVTFFRLKGAEVHGNMSDSLYIVNPDVTTENNTNIILYFWPGL